MKLYLTRHGQTEENKKGILQGHIPGKLSSLGMEQAKKLALRLKDIDFDIIYSSDLARALDTAKIITKFHKDTRLVISKELRERFFASHQGKEPPKDFINGFTDPNTETEEALIERAKNFIHKIYHENKEKTVLIVAHGGFNLALTSTLTGDSLEKVKDQSNTAVNIFEVDEEAGHKLILENCTEHLK